MKFVHLSDLHLGKRVNEYAPTEDECEVKLAELIREMKAEFGMK